MAAKPQDQRPRKDQEREPRPQQFYLFQFSYSPEAWDDMLRHPAIQDRISPIKEIVRALEGCFPAIHFPCAKEPKPPHMKEKWITFGDYDVVTIVAFPDDETAAAFAMKVSAGGSVKTFKTTKLLPWDQGMNAMARAMGRSLPEYVPPGKPRGR